MSNRAKAIYLDAHATTAVDSRVLAEMLPLFSEHFGNPSSTAHTFGWYAAELVEIARESVAALIGSLPEEIVFTSGATESCALALQGAVAAARRLTPGRSIHLLVSAIEHRAVLEPARALREDGVQVEEIPVTTEGVVEPAAVAAMLRPETLLTAVMLANNEIGTVQPIEAIARVVRNHGSALLVDAAQGPGRVDVSGLASLADFVTLSAHKMYGPKGAGALMCRQHAPRIEPIVRAGGQERGMRGGTLNVPAIAGFGAAARLASVEWAEDAARMSRLAETLLTSLAAVAPDVRRSGENAPRLPGNIHVALPGVDHVRLLSAVGSTVAISASSACQSESAEPSHVLRAIGVPDDLIQNCIRIGLSRMTTASEIERAGELLVRAIRGIRSA